MCGIAASYYKIGTKIEKPKIKEREFGISKSNVKQVIGYKEVNKFPYNQTHYIMVKLDSR